MVLMIMDMDSCYKTIASETEAVLAKVDEKGVGHLIHGIDRARRIFCGASGRSGYILRCFCMRLMHLGYAASFAGETTTPPIGKNDILIVVSGSGKTSWTKTLAEKAKEAGAQVYGIIGAEGSPLAALADHWIHLPAPSKEDFQGFRSEQPRGSLFEQAAFLLLESVVLACYRKKGSDAQALLQRHANLE